MLSNKGVIMSIQQHEIDNFFNRYESRFNKVLSGGEPDIDATVNSFAEHFIEANPSGVIVGSNDKKFRKMVAQGWTFYKSIGILSMNVMSKQITVLDNFHALVKVQWNSSFVRKDKTEGDVTFDVFYLLQKRDEVFKIFGYITGDEHQALKDEGLIP